MCYPQIKTRIQKQDDPEGRKVPEYRTLHAIADGRVSKFRDALVSAITQVTDSPEVRRQVEEALRAGDYQRAGSLIDLDTLDRILEEELAGVISDLVESAANNSVKYFPPAMKEIAATTGFAFQLENPFVQDYITAHANELVVQISNRTRQALKVITRRAFSEGLTVKEQADLIFNTVGLYDRLANAYFNYRARLIDEGVQGAELERKLKKKYDELLTYRANMIARTETITASNAGQRLVYDQAVRENLAHGKTLMKRWIVTPDDFLCPHCRALGRQGWIPYDEDWTSSRYGTVKNPTLHPHCRCAVAYEVFLQ